MKKKKKGNSSNFMANSFSTMIDGNGDQVSFSGMTAMFFDSVSQHLLIADGNGYSIRKMNQTYFVSTIAGDGSYGMLDGQGTLAQIAGPASITMDLNGNVFFGDTNAVRKINSTGYVSTIAGIADTAGNSVGPFSSAMFNFIGGMVFDSSRNQLLVSDTLNHKIKALDFNCKLQQISNWIKIDIFFPQSTMFQLLLELEFLAC